MAYKTTTLRDLVEGLLDQFDPMEAEDILRNAANKAGIEAVRALREQYPPPPPGPNAPSPLVTAKQWRWWWAMMRNIAEGREVPDSLRGYKAAYRKVRGHKTLVISGHYKRTGTAVRSLNYDVVVGREGAAIRVGPGMARQPDKYGAVASYAQYLFDWPPDKGGKQARIHQGRWEPMYQILQDANEQIVDAFFDSFLDDVMRRLQARGWQGVG